MLKQWEIEDSIVISMRRWMHWLDMMLTSRDVLPA